MRLKPASFANSEIVLKFPAHVARGRDVSCPPGPQESMPVPRSENAQELELDRAFWDAISASHDFQKWLLARTAFDGLPLDLVTNEGWHQRWYRDSDTGEESETDILLLFKHRTRPLRYAVHIENKPLHGKWRPDQAKRYAKRALNRMVPIKYAVFQTALIAPRAFMSKHPSEIAHFGFTISYEEIGEFVPAFAAACIADGVT
jgi:hypothetical protein